MNPSVKVAVQPHPVDVLLAAVIEAGGVVAPGSEAEAIVWNDASDPEGLRSLLATSDARWVQLPFAGIESFIESGVVTPDRTWTCAKTIYGPACAEMAVALMLTGARQLQRHARNTTWGVSHEEAIAQGAHRRGPSQRRLRGTTALVIGTGGIGRAFTTMIAPFDVRVIAVNRSGAAMPGAERTAPRDQLGTMIGEADHVVVAAALTPETRHLIDARMLGLMRPDAWLVNVARGGLVDTDALVAALRDGKIGGAALDVTDPEPLPDGHPLWSLPNAIITSHTANTWEMAVPELCDLVGRNVRHFAADEQLEGLVDPDHGY